MNHQKCQCGTCQACAGGLFYCRVCGLYEGGLTTDCPGGPVIEGVSDRVYQGRIDYRGREWVEATSPHCPSAYAEAQVETVSAEEDSLLPTEVINGCGCDLCLVSWRAEVERLQGRAKAAEAEVIRLTEALETERLEARERAERE